jgi:dTDP-4-dehydrorhamnose reductase
MKILIVGASGQVGSALVNQAERVDNVEMMAVGRTELDITNRQAVFKLVNIFGPDVIINAAAYTAVDKAENDVELCFLVNSDGPKFLAEAANSIGAFIIHISTDYVFSGDKEGYYSETDNPSPQSVYGLSKLSGENAVIESCPRYVILRTAWIFSEQDDNFVKKILHLAKTHKKLNIVCDQFGGPTYAVDIASALLIICQSIYEDERDKFGIYHFSGLPHVSWSQFAQAIFESAVKNGKLGKLPDINPIMTENYPTVAKRPLNSKLHTFKISDVFDISASDWTEALDIEMKNIKMDTD